MLLFFKLIILKNKIKQIIQHPLHHHFNKDIFFIFLIIIIQKMELDHIHNIQQILYQYNKNINNLIFLNKLNIHQKLLQKVLDQ